MNIQASNQPDVLALIGQAKEAGVILAEEKGQLKVWGPREALQDSPLLDQLRAKRLEVIAHLSTQGRAETLIGDASHRHDPFPLTEIQRAYWVGRQQAFDQGDVSIHYYTEVDGTDLDLERLQKAWNQTVQQHDMLRTVVDQDAVQRILPKVPDYQIGFTDLRKMTKLDRERCLAEHRAKTSQTIHSTEEWPGFALHLFQLTKTKFRLTYSQDLLHIDGGSLLNVVDTFCRLYTGEANGAEQFDISFRDYVFHEIALKETDSYKTQLAFWEQAVKDLPPPPNLPQASTKSTGTTFERRAFELDAKAFETIKTQAERLNVTPTTYIMALFSEVVSAWNSAEDYALNVTVFNRPNIHPQIHKIAGDFTSMMPMAIRANSGDTVAARAAVLQKTLWDQMSHKDVSGITVLDLLRKAKGEHGAANLSVVFTSLLNLSNQGLNPVLFDGIGTQSFIVTQTPQVTLDHQVFETAGGGIGFSWDVIKEQFPAGMIDDMFDTYRRVIEACLADEAAWQQPRLNTLPPEHAALYAEVNDTEAEFAPDSTLRDLFYAQVEANPDAVALATSQDVFSYAEVARMAEQLAYRLVRHGTAPGDRVGIFMEKGWQQPVAAMAAHVCGASYVPIDPTAPQDRLRYIVEDASLKVLLVDSTTASGLGALNIPSEIVNDTLRSQSERAKPSLLAPSDVSHLIYTSGSTGKPKGVIIEHGNVVNRMCDINSRFDISTGDAILGLTALHHDLSVYDIFGTWAAGAKLVLPDVDNRLNPGHWCDLMRAHGVTLWNSVPAFAAMLADYLEATGDTAEGLPLRWMILAGDWIPVGLPKRVHAVWPELRFIASGGPTETTIWDIWNEVDEVDPDAASVIYGKPLANASYHILDTAGQPCPVWVPGEMYIGGAGVTRGYLNRDDLNAEKYLTVEGHPTKLFRSGDLGRYMPDGSIEFLGRNDFQVKINGQRIELGEVEAAAIALPAVSDAVAVVQTSEIGRELALFVVDNGQSNSSVDLEAQTLAFKERGVSVIDPTERLEAKLKYAALSPDEGASLIPLPQQVLSEDVSQSHRAYQQERMSLASFARFFEPLQGWMDPVHGEAKLQYGSAGGLYPVQVYFYLKPDRVEGLDAGVYRYFPLTHAFEQVSACEISDDMHWGYNRPMGASAPFWIYLIADLEVISAQYGDLADDMALLEAGMITQLLRDAAARTGFGICSCGDISFDTYRDKFSLCAHQRLLTSMTAGLTVEETETSQDADLCSLVETALGSSLPKHMVPVRITQLQEMPLTGNGKVDRKRLMAMSRPAETARACVPPADAFEAKVVEVLGTLLGRDTVSVTDNFFEIGANSALLVKAYREITDAVGESFALIEMFRFPTVRSLAENVATGGPKKPKSRAGSARAEKQKAMLKNRRSIKKGKS